MSAVATRVASALYCGTYAKYNNGSTAGKWLKLRDYNSADDFLLACRYLHRDEADPELMFQDFEGMPPELYNESLSLADLRRIYDWVHLDDDDRALLGEYLDATGYSALSDVDIPNVRDKLFCILVDSDYSDHNTAMGWYVVDNGLVDVPEALRTYIDMEALGRDWLMDLYVSSNGYVFEA